jgi:isopentenyl diphosphate isomerase/L-lactate dehydrogenase-like FMN-dependent dehydrogenase
MAEAAVGSDEFLTLQEFIPAARARLTRDLWNYLIGAAETETTLKRNRLALDSLAFRPRVLRDVSEVDCTAPLFGRPHRLPVILAPVGSIEGFEPGGTATVARAAGRFGVPMCVSSAAAPGLEATAKAADGTKIYQLYLAGDETVTDDVVRRAEDVGYHAFCFTVDTALYSRRERDLINRNLRRWRGIPGRRYQAEMTWDHVKRYKDKHRLPLLLKGIATAEDAALAVEHGVDVVWVSNHGGRQLDHGRGSIDVLPEAVAAVAGRARVIVDSGFSRGTDVIKALALGADAVAIGRLYCYALAAAGEAGVVRALEILESEISISLGLLGVARWAELDGSYVHAAPPVAAPGVHSAFPLLEPGG